MRRVLGIGLVVSLLTGASLVAPAAAQDNPVARLKAPDGFTVGLFAKGLSRPRMMTVGEDGSLYVAENGANQVTRLTDADGDGVAEKRDVIATDMPLAHGVEWHDGWLYVSEGNRVEKIQDADGDGKFEGREVVTTEIPDAVHHVTRTVHFGPDGKMYVSVGSSSNNDPETDPRRAAILRFNADGSIPDDNPFANDPDPNRRPIWAEGLRNSVDFLFTPDGKLWADHNGSDDLGNDVPPEKVVIDVQKGKNYGWPYCYTPVLGVVPPGTADVQDTRVPFGGSVSSCDTNTPTLFTDLAHSAPLGMVMYNATAFPEKYQGNIFEAYHGSWNSSVARDCKVQMIVVQDGLPVSSEPFLTGFRDNDQQNCGSAWGRPAGVAVGKNGELFVSDDQNGNIYRVTYTG